MKKANCLILLSIVVALTSHCSKKSAQPTTASAGDATSSQTTSNAPISMDESSSSSETLTNTSSTIYFDYDQATLNSEARSVLQKMAADIKNRTNKINIEGHCDERGSNEYNLALGESRARAVKDYLKKLGVSSDKINTTSFGEEKPADLGQGEGAWAKNRRAELVVNN